MSPLAVEEEEAFDSLDIDSDMDSLFDEPQEETMSEHTSSSHPQSMTYHSPAGLMGPPIGGLYFDSSTLLPPELVKLVMQKCTETYFRDKDVNQVMLFERADRVGQSKSESVPFIRWTCL